MDSISKKHRSWNMSRIRSVNSKPEIIVRKFLFSKGFRYRLHSKDLPGKPDIVFKNIKVVIFINGCFWHQHKNCTRSNIPKSNKHYWVSKLKKNVERDKKIRKEINRLNWKVITIWECQLKKSRVDKYLNNLFRKLLLQKTTSLNKK